MTNGHRDLSEREIAERVAVVLHRFASFMEAQADGPNAAKLDKIAAVCGGGALRGMARVFREAGTIDVEPDQHMTVAANVGPST